MELPTRPEEHGTIYYLLDNVRCRIDVVHGKTIDAETARTYESDGLLMPVDNFPGAIMDNRKLVVSMIRYIKNYFFDRAYYLFESLDDRNAAVRKFTTEKLKS